MMKKRKANKLAALLMVAAMSMTALPGTLMANATAISSGSQGGKFYADYATTAEATAAAEELNVRINEEGTVLLKNNGALPASAKSESVSVFGYSAKSIQGASGVTDFSTALESVGFKVNPTLKSFYAGVNYKASDATTGQGRGEVSDFTAAVNRSIENYGDVAFVTVTRYGSESTGSGDHRAVLDGRDSGAGFTSDKAKKEIASEEENIGGWEHEALYKDEDGTAYMHGLMLTNEEIALLNHVKSLKAEGKVKKIVYVINSAVPIEMYNLEHDDDVDAILMIHNPGQNGLNGVANVISGRANPTGKTQMIYPRDFTADPVWSNVGSNRQTNADYAAAQEGDVTASKISYHYTENGEGKTTINTIYEYPHSNSSNKQGLNQQGLFGTDYEEDIYRDYMYYETVAAEMNKKEAGSGDAWYKEHVVYPFGYGLSYSADFKYEIESVKLNDGTKLSLAGDTTLSAAKLASSKGNEAKIKSGVVTVKVTNVGGVAAKNAVELYSQAAYGKVETPQVRLVGFEKTDEILPGASQTIKISFNFQDMASYDWRGLASDGAETGYVLEEGEFKLHVSGDSNAWMDTTRTDYDGISFELDSRAYLHLDDFSGNEINNLFSAENGIYSTVRDPQFQNGFSYNADPSAKMTLLSRSDLIGTFPQGPTKADMELSLDALNRITYWSKFHVGSGVTNYNELPYLDAITGTGAALQFTNATPADFNGTIYQDGQDVWSKDGKVVAAGTEGATKIVDGAKDFPWIEEFKAAKEDMKSWSQAPLTTKEKAETQLVEMNGKNPYDEAEGTEAWNDFMDQLTYNEMEQLCLRGETPNKDTASRVGIGALSASDGSNKMGGYSWAANGKIASTWSKDIAAKQGRIAGNLWLLAKTNVYWGGAAQTIRSVWAGRNGEFHSTDSFLTGAIAAKQTRGLTEKGIVTFIKHGILNDQSTPYNAGMITWVSEQAIREVYAKSFQMAVQEGGANGLMSSYARLGVMYSGINYNFHTGLINGEWGAQSLAATTDNHAQLGQLTPGDMMARAGINQMNTGNKKGQTGTWSDEAQRVTYNTKFVAATADNNVLSEEDEGLLQWYLARRNAMVYLNARVNSKYGANGVSAAAWESKTFDLSQGTAAANVSVAGVTGSDEIVYTANQLPEGLTLNASTGAITGTPTAPGTTNVTVTALADGWISNTKSFTFNVASAFVFPENTKAAIDEAYLGEVAVSLSGNYTFTAEGLPAGLEMATNGNISGTPTQVGTFNVTVTAKTGNGNNAKSYSDTFAIVVEGEEAGEVHVHGGILSITKTGSEGLVDTYTINYACGDVDTLTVTNGANGENGLPGENGNDGATPVIEISEDNYWVINGVKSTVKAIGTDGANGNDGNNGKDGVGIKDVTTTEVKGGTEYTLSFTDGREPVVITIKDAAPSAVGIVCVAVSAIFAIVSIVGATLGLRKKKN